MRRSRIDDDPAYSFEPGPADDADVLAEVAWDHDECDADEWDEALLVEQTIEDVVDEFEERDDEDDPGRFSTYCQVLVDRFGLSVDEAMARLGRRSRDLAPARAGVAPARTRRASHARPAARIIGPYYALGSYGEPISLLDADGPDLVVHPDARGHEDRSDDPATRWLREQDPHLSAAGVSSEIDEALAAAGLTRRDVAAAFKRGKPTVERSALRDRLRAALEAMWKDGRRRDLMAQALGCNRRSVQRLMRP